MIDTCAKMSDHLRNKISRMRAAAARMDEHHREVCEAMGDYPDEADSFYSLAAEALRQQAALLSRPAVK